MTRPFFWSVSALTLATAYACGGAQPSDFFTGNSDTTVDTDTGVIDTNSDSGVVTKTDGGIVVGKDSGPPDSGVVKADAGQPAVIECGGSQCQFGNEVCCRDGNGDNCTSLGSCQGFKKVPIACDDSGDCANQGKICCGTFVPDGKGNTVVSTVSCTSAGNCNAGAGRREICNILSVTDTCVNGGACQKSDVSIKGYGICVP